MANYIFSKAKAKIATAQINLTSDDIRALIVMTNTTIDTSEDIAFLGDLSAANLDEYDGAGYVRIALSGKQMVEDLSANLTKFTSDPAGFANISQGTRSGQAMVIYKHVGADSVNIPLFYHEPTGFPFTGNGEDVIIYPNATTGWWRF